MLTNVPITSISAYRSHQAAGRARGQCLLILNFIREAGGDWSIGELAQALEMEKSTVSGRVYELLHETGELAATPKRPDRVSGVMVRPVSLAAQPTGSAA
jgi:hypothetical protein